MPRRALAAAVVLAVAALAALPTAGAHRLPKAPGYPILPKSNAFNQRVDRLPVARNSPRSSTRSAPMPASTRTSARGPTTAGRSGSRTRSWASARRRYHEVAKGSIDHALRFTARRTRRAYVPPARHFASGDSDPSLPPMGLRVRLMANVRLAGLGRQARVVARALKRYGALLADNARRGSSAARPTGAGTTTTCTRSTA